MSLISKRSIVPFILLLVFAVLDQRNPPIYLTGVVIALAAIFVGTIISDAANQIVAELRETRQQLNDDRDQAQSKDAAESWK